MIELTDKNYSEEINKDRLKLIYFHTPSCPACVGIKPILEFIENDISELDVYSCDLTRNPKISAKYEIRSVPTTMFVDLKKNIKYAEAGIRDISYFQKCYRKLTRNKFFLF